MQKRVWRVILRQSGEQNLHRSESVVVTASFQPKFTLLVLLFVCLGCSQKDYSLVSTNPQKLSLNHQSAIYVCLEEDDIFWSNSKNVPPFVVMMMDLSPPLRLRSEVKREEG